MIYDTMWGSTELMARAIADGVRFTGVEAHLFHLRKNDWSLLIKEMMEAPVFALGSPTMHNSMFFTVGGFLTYLKGLSPKGKKAVAFGSYGWGGGATKQVEEILEQSKVELVDGACQIKFKPAYDDLQACRELGIRLAEIAKSESNDTLN